MALASVHCYPLLRISPPSVSKTASVLRKARGARRPQRCPCSQYADERQPPQQLERLFSNLNKATMKHEPGNARSGAVPCFNLLSFLPNE
jgi:tyrosine-specific transport protein